MTSFRSLAPARAASQRACRRGFAHIVGLPLGLLLAGLAAPFAHAQQEPRLANVSTLTRAGAGDDVLIAGFSIRGTAAKRVVIRGIGPTLGLPPASGGFGVTGAMADPLLELYAQNNNTPLATNDNWNLADVDSFDAVGAFRLPQGSRDAAIVTTLQPGTYSAALKGVNNSTGVALIEVYEVGGGTSKFFNLSTRAQVGGPAGPLRPGFVITQGGGTRRMLIRAAGPSLAQFTGGSTAGLLLNPTLTLNRSGTGGGLIATNDDWGTPVGPGNANATQLMAAFNAAGAFGFTGTTSRDSALLVDLPPGDYNVEVNGMNNTSGIALVEVYDISPDDRAFVSVSALKASADETGAKNGEVVFTRTGPTTEALALRYAVGGSAVNGSDYLELSGTITIPAGASSVSLPILINPDLQTEGTDTVVVSLLTQPNYILGGQTSVTVTIADSPATLYIASIRPEMAATGSTASGTATILLSADNSLAAINIAVSNLSSAVTSAHLRIGPTGDFVFNLPYTASGTAHWTFAPVGNYTSAQLLEALRTGNIYVGLDTASFPTGEVRGSFVQGTGSTAFTAPAAPPAVSLENVTVADAARLLTQATFGPKRSEIDALAGKSIAAWIDAQLALPFTSHRAAVLEDHRLFGGSSSVTNFNAIHPPNRQAAWWKVSLNASDQLRQRVAFALSQIFVVSDVSLGDDSRAEPLAHYYDLLGNGAFGNFRVLLENVTLSPIMGEYLSHLRNSKANAAAGTTPDENYAREIMQLFTIGLSQLHPDGTLVLGPDALPIPTYNQTTITELAKVFTGWAYPSTNQAAFRTAGRNFISPMQLFPAEHDDTVKNIAPVRATPIPAGQGGAADLRQTLDTLVAHPNTAPFIARRLIQRLVTSNPSPAYVYRVAQVFRNEVNNPTQLASVVRAILTDFEARSPQVAANISFGKLKEPILRLSAFLRATGAAAQTGRYSGHIVTLNGTQITSASTYNPATMPAPVSIAGSTGLRDPQGSLAQASLRSPTVFNFFSPDYVLPGPLATAGLVAPEFEITDDTYATNVPNYLRAYIFATSTLPTNPTQTQIQQASTNIVPDLTAEQNIVNDIPALIDHLSLVFTANTLSSAARTRIIAGMNALPTTTSAADKARSAFLMVLSAPQAAVQR